MAEGKTDEEARVEEAAVQVDAAGRQLSPDVPLEHTGHDGQTLKGNFRFRVATIGDMILIGTRSAEYVRGETGLCTLDQVPVEIANLADMAATLSVVVAEHPPWWTDPRECSDPTLLVAVHNAYAKWSTFFRASGSPSPEGDRAATR